MIEIIYTATTLFVAFMTLYAQRTSSRRLKPLEIASLSLAVICWPIVTILIVGDFLLDWAVREFNQRYPS